MSEIKNPPGNLIPTSEQIPDDPDRLPPARRRRARRLLAPLDADERAAFVDNLAHRVSPSFDFFLFSLLAGVIIGLGLWFGAPAFLIFGAILAPLLAPVTGLGLGTVTGSVKLFVRSLVGLAIGGLFVFLAGYGIGYALHSWVPPEPLFTTAHLHTQLSWADFLILALSAILTTATITNPDRNSSVLSVGLAYELYIPLAAAGFGLARGLPGLWPDGLVVFALYLAWAALLGALTLAILGFRPLSLFGYTLGGAVTLVGVILLIGLSGASAVFVKRVGLPTPVPTATFTPTRTPTPTLTPVPPTSTFTPTVTFTPTRTPVPPTATLTPTPTPRLALVAAAVGNGINYRTEPGGTIIAVLSNGTQVQVLPGTVEKDDQVWVQIVTPQGTLGWVLESLLAIVTPTPAS